MYEMKKFDSINYQVIKGDVVEYLIIQYSDGRWGLVDALNGNCVSGFVKSFIPQDILNQLNHLRT